MFQPKRARFGGSMFIQCGKKSACEGHGGSEGFITHEGTRITDPKGTYKLGEAWKCSDQVWAYWTADATTASLGTVMAVGTMKSYVVLDDADEGLIPNDWDHKVVRVGGGVAGGLPRFGGSYLIQLDSTRAFEGKFEGKEFVGHDGDRREISKSDVYKLGEAWQCNGQVWAYWREEQKDLHAGWVTAVGSEKSYVEFDDGEKGPVPNSWIHKMVRFGGGAIRFGGSHLIHWDSTRAFEGKFEGNYFVAHDGDRREISKSDIYTLGEVWQCNDKVWTYWTEDHKYLHSGKVIAVGAEKSFVEIDAGDKGTVPNGWIHKMVRFSGGTARFGGSHLIHWDTTRAFEGKFEGNDFVAHDGDRREISKSDIYKLGEVWQCNDKVWAYYTEDHKYLNSGKVTAVGAEKSYVEFDDKDKGLLPNEWIHKMVSFQGNTSNLNNNNNESNMDNADS
ncbi:unnamed protein product [Cladocopium goreaui]|uniref:ATP-dependent zinc metalloprotease FTSH 10, mitochondrial n=1 Tax=Cladocopium goreaui TaxID=2562237 RepID=A0A9P1GMP4_9DINO|nr:unnamed protein product [Cladocopium goreaui]